jgi:hypothetical protein
MLSQNQMVAVRKVIENTYNGKCTVTEHQKVVKNDHSTGFEDVVVYEDISCRLSFENITTTNQTDTANALVQTIKLFISPDIEIKPGSKISVIQDNVNADYKCSGVPAIYPTHQEIILDEFKGWA